MLYYASRIAHVSPLFLRTPDTRPKNGDSPACFFPDRREENAAGQAHYDFIKKVLAKRSLCYYIFTHRPAREPFTRRPGRSRNHTRAYIIEVCSTMYSLLLQFFWIIVIVDFFILAVMLLFMVNARITLQRHIVDTRFFMNVVHAAQKSTTSAEAGAKLDITAEEFSELCKTKGIDSPEVRKEKKEMIEKKKKDEENRIMEEEALWRAEQEKIIEEHRVTQEAEARERKERLKKFGFR